MTDSSTRKGLVVSDLHLFSRRSDADRLFGKVRSGFGEPEALVLNGDTFDFRWSSLPSESATIDAAIRWLEGLLEEFADSKIHYLLGNHDCLTVFQRELEELVRSHPRLSCHEHRLQLGENLFLHGDCANRRMNEAALQNYRSSWSRDRQRGPIAARTYELADSLGLSRRFHDLYFPDARSVRRVAHHLDQVTPGWNEKVRHCYFGHTHRPFRDFFWKGVRFSNTGSAIRGMGFQPLEFQWSPNHHDSTLSDERKSHLLL